MPIDSFLQQLFSLKDKTALVTGASGGLGRAMAVALAGAGARIGIHGTKADKLEETRQAIEQVGGDGVVLSASLGDAAQCQKLAADAQSALGRIDILLNCAGTSRRKLIDTVTQEEFDWIIGVNLRSAFFLSQAVHPMMRQQGGGKIINIGSMTSTLGFANLSVYGMTKSALAQATKTMAIEWAADNIQVNCVAPWFHAHPVDGGVLLERSAPQPLDVRPYSRPSRRPAGRSRRHRGLAGVACVRVRDRTAHRGRWRIHRRRLVGTGFGLPLEDSVANRPPLDKRGLSGSF